MKKSYPIGLTFLLMVLTLNVHAQVGVGTTTPDASAQLDITSDSKGILIPRMTATQRSGISNAAEGLLVYQTTAPAGFYYYNGSQWVPLRDPEESVPSLYAGNSMGTLIPVTLVGSLVPLPSHQLMSGFIANGANTVFTVPATGRYQISYRIGITQAFYMGVQIAINGVAYPPSQLNSLSQQSIFFNSFLVDLSAGDAVGLQLVGLGVATLTLDGGTNMAIVKLD